MSKAVPHFSVEWLEAYNARIKASGKKSAPRPAGGRPQITPSRARVPDESEMVDYNETSSSVPVAGWTGKQTKTEERYNRDILGGLGRFEAVCLYLPGGGRYTPDFMTLDGGVVTFHEVKGSYRLGSQGRAYTAFHEAVAAFPMWRFVWATEKKGGGFSRKVFDQSTISEGRCDNGQLQ